jgi:DNA-binding SARP family transcriptional activator
MAEGLWLTLLGAPRVALNDVPLRGFVSAKVQALLFYLALTRRAHSRAALAALLWGEMPDADARANLRVALSNLRQLIGDRLTVGRDQVVLDPQAPCCSDVGHLQRAVAQLSLPPTPQQIQALRAAVELYRGDFLEGFSLRDALGFEEWALLQREHLRQIALQGLHLLSGAAGEAGAVSEAIGYTQRLLALDPWREETHRQLMRLLALSGQREAALAQYEICRRTLARELGAVPLEATTALYERLRAEQPEPRPAAGPQRAGVVGRADEHAWLAREWEQARESGARLSLVEGEAGVGKTRLVEELLGTLAGALVLRGRCQRFGAALPYQPIAAALRSGLEGQAALARLPAAWLPALARLLPDLHSGPAALRDESSDETARLRLFEAVARALLALCEAPCPGRPLILFLDDLHHADQASLDLLGFLIERLAERPIWFVATYRPEELDEGHPLLALRHALGRAGALALLELAPLSEASVGALVGQLDGIASPAQALLTAYLARRSCGNPFLLIHFLRDLEQRRLIQRVGPRWRLADPAALDTPACDDAALPLCVREQVMERVGRLSAGARALLERMALLEQSCEPELLAALAADVPGLSACLGECLERRLLTFLQPGGYRFAHPVTRQAIRAALRPDQRQRLLALAAAALEQPGRSLRPPLLAEAGALLGPLSPRAI